MEIQKTANSKEELFSVIEQLDSEEYTSYQIEKVNGTFVVQAKNNTQSTIEEIEKEISAYVNKKIRYGIDLVFTRVDDDDDNTVSFDLTLGGNFILPWGKHYRVGDIDCYLNESKTFVEELRLSLYTDLVPKEKLVELKKQYDCFEAYGVGSPPMYYVYVYNINNLKSIFSVLDSLAHPKES